MYLLHSPQFQAVRDHSPAAPLNMSAHLVFGRPILLLPFLTSHSVAACAYPHQSILATWPPHFHFRP